MAAYAAAKFAILSVQSFYFNTSKKKESFYFNKLNLSNVLKTTCEVDWSSLF